MEIRFQVSPKEAAAMETDELRKHFLCEKLIGKNHISTVYTHYDRMILGGTSPLEKKIFLETDEELRAIFFLERREMGIINTGGTGLVETDTGKYALDKLSCLYLGKGTKTVHFSSESAEDPAVFYFLSAPAHTSYPNRLMKKEEASAVAVGFAETSNQRTIYKYIHADGIPSCQLVMGLTVLSPGSVWNSVPPHTHTRRMEIYFYFDLPEENRVFHFMGEPQQTRHLVMGNHQAVISPPWSIHCGCGTTNYAFIWGMAGENMTFTDMDPAPVAGLR
jgi:4-deoxy-L-threo-5-hexosulose-uronate ketol-isomerase